MASRIPNLAQELNQSCLRVSARWNGTATTGVPTNFKGEGSVTVGASPNFIYSYVLPDGDGGVEVLGVHASVLQASGVNGRVLVKSINEATRTITLQYALDDGTSGVPAAAPLLAADALFLEVVVQNSFAAFED